MEYYIDNNKYIVDGDIYINGKRKSKFIIGANNFGNAKYGGYLSCFDKVFTDETIGIESGFDQVNAVIGEVDDAYEMLDKRVMEEKPNDIIELSNIVFEVVDNYFGGISNLNSRMSYYIDDESLETGQINKISDLKSKGCAACVERSALSQNLLKHLGIKSYYKASGILKNNNEELHCYNLIDNNGEYYIFDSSIPTLINDKINPLVAKIDKESFDLITCPLSQIGISISTSHYNPYRDIDVSITYDFGRKKQITVESLDNEFKKRL